MNKFDKLYEGMLTKYAGKLARGIEGGAERIERKGGELKAKAIKGAKGAKKAIQRGTVEKTRFGKLNRAKAVLGNLKSEYSRSRQSLIKDYKILRDLVKKADELKKKVIDLYGVKNPEAVAVMIDIDNVRKEIDAFSQGLLDKARTKVVKKAKPVANTSAATKVSDTDNRDVSVSDTKNIKNSDMIFKIRPHKEEDTEEPEKPKKAKVKKPAKALRELGWSNYQIRKMSTEDAIEKAKNQISPDVKKPKLDKQTKKKSILPKAVKRPSDYKILKVIGYDDSDIDNMEDEEKTDNINSFLRSKKGKAYLKSLNEEIIGDEQYQLFCEVFESELELL